MNMIYERYSVLVSLEMETFSKQSVISGDLTHRSLIVSNPHKRNYSNSSRTTEIIAELFIDSGIVTNCQL